MTDRETPAGAVEALDQFAVAGGLTLAEIREAGSISAAKLARLTASGYSLTRSVDVERLRCGRCGDELLPDELTGHLASEGRVTVDVERWQRIETAARPVIRESSFKTDGTPGAYPSIAAIRALRDALGEVR